MRAKPFFALVIGLALPPEAPAQAASRPAIVCHWPMVPTARAALEIYGAVTRAWGVKAPHGDKIEIWDQGDHWTVFPYPKRIPPPKVEPDGTTTYFVVAGGGGFDMKIDKCDGTISASYAR